jgi:DNA-binding NtrC family response regulator
MKKGRILVIDDDEDVLFAARMVLKPHVETVLTSPDPAMLPELLNEQAFDVIFLDMNFKRDVSSGNEGFYWLKEIRDRDPQSVVVLMTAYGGVETAVRAMKEGATDFVLKPWQNEKLLATLASAFTLRETRHEVEKWRTRQHQLSRDLDTPYHDIIGSSAPMREVFRMIEKVAKTDANVLILGENGTGKELVARALHRGSERSNEMFLSVDMGSITESLFESELFGHTKGAFTDARDERPGRFEVADGGSLFLDEIGNLSLSMQSKLLTVIQNREVTRVGSSKPVAFDTRLIFATNMPIHDMVMEKTFRQDLLYRINTVEISLPPLRERGKDVLQLARHFLQTYAKKYRKVEPVLSVGAEAALMSHSWPGNIRELQHAMERAVIMSESHVLEPADVIASNHHRSVGLEEMDLENMEKTVIRRALDRYDGNITRAANELGLTRAALYRRIEKYGL